VKHEEELKLQEFIQLPPICGTHFDDTKLVASIVFKPVFDSRLMSSIFTAAGTIFGSFCRPSRGPTSTILTELKFLRKIEENLWEIMLMGIFRGLQSTKNVIKIKTDDRCA
jgi:hypothetical protein